MMASINSLLMFVIGIVVVLKDEIKIFDITDVTVDTQCTDAEEIVSAVRRNNICMCTLLDFLTFV